MTILHACAEVSRLSEQSNAQQAAESFQLMNEEAIDGHVWADRDPSNVLNPAVPPRLLSKQNLPGETRHEKRQLCNQGSYIASHAFGFPAMSETFALPMCMLGHKLHTCYQLHSGSSTSVI